jgi:hypothetical protein
VKQREVKKPSFPDFGSFGVPPAFRPPKPRFAGFASIYLFFYNFIFCFFHYNLILHNLIFRTAQSLQSFLSGTRCLPVIIYICFSDRSNLFIFLCTTIWLCRTKSLAAFRLTFSWVSFKAPISLGTNFFDCADNAQLQPFYKRAFIESLPAGKPTGAAVDSCCTL